MSKIVRVGYKSLFSAILLLIRMNKDLKKLKCKGKYIITLPIKWF